MEDGWASSECGVNPSECWGGESWGCVGFREQR